MKKIAIVYSFNTTRSKNAAQKIAAEFKESQVEHLNAEELTGDKLMKYSNFILSLPTWFDGELPNYWDEFVPEIEDMDLKGKLVALYGLGDQKGYPENFQDAIGIMAELLETQGAKIVGSTSTDGYSFERSKAVRNNLFLGLAIDFESQASKNKTRIPAWVESLKSIFK